MSDLPDHVRRSVDAIEREVGDAHLSARDIEGSTPWLSEDAEGDSTRRGRGGCRPDHHPRHRRGPGSARACPGRPARVQRMYAELTAGYHVDADRLINGAIFEVDYSEMVVVRGISFSSLCEHHLLPFFGTAAVAYIPRGRVHRAVQDPAHRRDVCPPAPGPGAHDPADRRLPHGTPRSQGRRRGRRGDPPVRHHARRAQARHAHDHERRAGPVPVERQEPGGVPEPPRSAGADAAAEGAPARRGPLRRA